MATPLDRPMQILLAMNCKDEKNIVEWVLYHSMLGFNRLLIFDDQSLHPVHNDLWEYPFLFSFLSALGVTVEIKRYHAPKNMYLKHALRMAREYGSHWMMYIDADEYLVPGESESIHDIIRKAPVNCNGIAFFWKCFGSSCLEKNPYPGRCIHVYTHSEASFTPKLKTLARVENICHFLSPHHYRFSDYAAELWEPSTARYIPNKPNHNHNILGEIIPHIYIAHYTDQSWECFCRRRSRPRDDTGQIRSFNFSLDCGHQGPLKFHERFNEHENWDPWKTLYTMSLRIIPSLPDSHHNTLT